GINHGAFICFACKAPISGEIQENRITLLQLPVEILSGKRLPHNACSFGGWLPDSRVGICHRHHIDDLHRSRSREQLWKWTQASEVATNHTQYSHTVRKCFAFGT